MTHLKAEIAFAQKSIDWNDEQLKFLAETMNDNLAKTGGRDLKFWRKQVAWHTKDRLYWVKELRKYQAQEMREK
jgi:hypothetical protein